MLAKKGLIDRFEQSLKLIFSSKNSFLKLILPIFLYKLIIGIFIWNFISYVLLGNIDFKNNIFGNPYYITLFIFIIIGFIFYITFFIGIVITTIKTIKNIYEEKEINIKENIKYGTANLFKSFNTYWYIFSYITIIPFIFIIFGGLLTIFGLTKNEINTTHLGLSIIGFGFLLLLFFMIYRGTKTKFSLISAIDKNDYSKKNFTFSIKITNSNWWRITLNFIFISIVLSFIFSFISIIKNIFTTSILNQIFDKINLSDLINSLFYNQKPNINIEDLKTIINDINKYSNTFHLNNFLISIINLFFEILKYIFILTFSFIFYKRLEYESKKENKIEL